MLCCSALFGKAVYNGYNNVQLLTVQGFQAGDESAQLFGETVLRVKKFPGADAQVFAYIEKALH